VTGILTEFFGFTEMSFPAWEKKVRTGGSQGAVLVARAPTSSPTGAPTWSNPLESISGPMAPGAGPAQYNARLLRGRGVRQLLHDRQGGRPSALPGRSCGDHENFARLLGLRGLPTTAPGEGAHCREIGDLILMEQFESGLVEVKQCGDQGRRSKRLH